MNKRLERLWTEIKTEEYSTTNEVNCQQVSKMTGQNKSSISDIADIFNQMNQNLTFFLGNHG